MPNTVRVVLDTNVLVSATLVRFFHNRIYLHQKHPKIIQLIFQNTIHTLVIHLAVQMHEHISEANHLDVHCRVVLREKTLCLQRADALAGVLCCDKI